MSKYRGTDPRRATRQQKIRAAKRYRRLGLTKNWDKKFRQATYSTELFREFFGGK